MDELRLRVTLSQLVARTVPLKKAGNEFKACCPFHNEKTPSFWVNDQKGFYHCFGCGAHGDALRWLTDARGLPFLDAVKLLADETGMELPKPEPEVAEQHARAGALQEVMEAATNHFQEKLGAKEGAGARNYLELREVDEGAISDFRIGYAPEGRNNIGRALGQFTTQQLIDVGLLISVEDKDPYDRFRNRIMVPIKDPRGRVIAFGGRILGDGEPKYLNSPDTVLFDKGRILFNLDRAGPASRQTNRIIVVEGYFDVVALNKVGIRDAVAPMGTALTEMQLEQLWRLADEPILCFDGDAAGRKAAERAAERAMPTLRAGKQLLIMILPQGKDPDDVVRQDGIATFNKLVENALPLSTFLYRSEREKIDGAKPEKRAGLRKRLDEIAQSCSDRFVADEFGRSFRSQFFEEFGWKQKQRQVIAGALVRTSARVAPNLSRLFVRSALYGLTRFPELALSHLEEVAQIPIAHPELRRWRDAIGEAVILNPSLDDDGIQAILASNVLPETLAYDIRSDLRFGFTRKKTERSVALRQLETLVTFLGEERELQDQLADLDKVAMTDDGINDFDAIERSRQILREARAKLFEKGADWDGALG